MFMKIQKKWFHLHWKRKNYIKKQIYAIFVKLKVSKNGMLMIKEFSTPYRRRPLGLNVPKMHEDRFEEYLRIESASFPA